MVSKNDLIINTEKTVAMFFILINLDFLTNHKWLLKILN